MFYKIKFFILSIFILSIFTTKSFALICSNYGDFKEYNGHYYTTTVNKLTFKDAKLLAENSGGYLAIPNSSSENAFIAGLIKDGEYSWIGVYDPTYTSNYCYSSTNCSHDDTRFSTVKGSSLLYKNWAEYQPDNLVMEYDVMDGKEMVSPLGEHWVAMAYTGKWADFGNHKTSYNNPIKYYAVFEFDTMPECYTPPTNFQEDQIAGTQCSTKIYNKDIDQTIDTGQLYDCQQDQYGTDYCPSQMAPCAQEWDYDDGYSVAGIGQVVDYTAKVGTSVPAVGSTNTIELYTGHYDFILQIKTYSNGKIELYSFFIDDWFSGSGHWVLKSSAPSLDAQPSYINKSFYASPSYIGNNKFCFDTKSSVQCLTVGVPNIVHLGNGQEVINITSNTDGTFTYRYHNVYNVPPDHSENFWLGLTCTDGSTPVNGMCTTYTCPSGYSDNGSNCKKNVNYTYYNYKCNSDTTYQGFDFEPINTGGDCNKIDTNMSTDNTTELSTACNSPTPPNNNCKREKFTCQANNERPCAFVNNSWQCSPFPCFGGDDIETTDTQVGLNDADNNGWDNSGNCLGQIYIFNGQDNRCRSKDILFGLVGGGCCDKDKVFLGLVACKEEEKKLAKLNNQERCHYVGEYCSKKLNLGFTKICVQWKKSHCCFNSKLARIINEQGRPQLAKGWGSAESPECKGFTPEEFQKLDFSKIDMSEFFGEIQQNFNVNFMQNQQNFIQNRITNNMNNISGN